MTNSITSLIPQVAHHVTDAGNHGEPHAIFNFITKTFNDAKKPIAPDINIEPIVFSVTSHLERIAEHGAARPLTLLMNNLKTIQFNHQYGIITKPEFQTAYENIIHTLNEIVVKYNLKVVDSSPTGKIIGSPFGLGHVAEHGLEKAIHLAIQYTKELTGEAEFLKNLKITLSNLYITNTQGSTKLITSKLLWLGNLMQHLKPIIGCTISAVFLSGLWKMTMNNIFLRKDTL